MEIIGFIGGVTKPISTYSTSNKEVSEKRVERRKSITISEHFVNLLAVPHRRLKLCRGYLRALHSDHTISSDNYPPEGLKQ